MQKHIYWRTDSWTNRSKLGSNSASEKHRFFGVNYKKTDYCKNYKKTDYCKFSNLSSFLKISANLLCNLNLFSNILSVIYCSSIQHSYNKVTGSVCVCVPMDFANHYSYPLQCRFLGSWKGLWLLLGRLMCLLNFKK